MESAKFGVGQSVPRKEDPRLVTGGGEFTDDVNFPKQLYLRVLRSGYAHGTITTLNIGATLGLPNCVGISERQNGNGCSYISGIAKEY